MTDLELEELGDRVREYCNKYQVPFNYLFDILEDQKVIPMIRGKANEYNVYLFLDDLLPKNTWSVQKLNLNPQQGSSDEDISITYRRTGIILKVESKTAVRGSFSSGKRAKKIKEPHFKVKCHRSRSNISKLGKGNDAYPVDAFDLIITNPLNAIYQSNTVSENLEIIQSLELKSILNKYYNVGLDSLLIQRCYADWRYVVPVDIGIDGFIPRTPYVKLRGDPNWKPLEKIEERLLGIKEEKRRKSLTRRPSIT